MYSIATSYLNCLNVYIYGEKLIQLNQEGPGLIDT